MCALVQCFGFEFVAESACITVWDLLRALNLWPSRPASQTENCCQLGWVLENKNSLTQAAQRILLFLFCGVCLDGLRRRQCFPPISNAICMFSALWCSLAWAWHWAHPHVLICESGSDLTLSISLTVFQHWRVLVVVQKGRPWYTHPDQAGLPCEVQIQTKGEIQTEIHTQIHTEIHTEMDALVQVWVCISLYIYIYICTSIWIHDRHGIYLHINIYLCASVHVHVRIVIWLKW